MKLPIHRLGELCQMVKGTAPTLKTPPGPFPLVVTADFRRTADTWQLEGPAVCIPLVSSTGHGDAALHRIHYQEGKFALANLLVALLPKNPSICYAKYLYYFLTTRKNELLVPLMQGTANVSLKEQDIAGVEIPLPPLAEQRRTVERLEQLSSHVNEARALRQRGRDEAAALFEAAVGKVMSQADRYPKEELGKLCSKIGSGSTPSGGRAAYPASGIPFIRSLNVRMRYFQWEEIAHISPETHAQMVGTQVQPNDVLLNITGASIGRVACAPHDLLEANVNQHVMIIRPRDVLQPRYLMYWLSQPTVQEFINDKQKGATRQGFTKSQIQEFQVPVPSLTEQSHIVTNLDALQEKMGSLRLLQNDTATELDALIPSVLDKAFRGEL